MTDPLGVRLLYAPHDPTPQQAAFLKLGDLGVRDAFYGGAAGGGKSDALLMAALQYVDVPGYSALLLRKTYNDLALPGAIMDRSKAWLNGTDARWNETLHRWTFPSKASLTFGFLQHPSHRYRYASAEFQFIGFDELTQFQKADFRFLFSRLRGPSTGPLSFVPLRMRGAGNPGGIGHDWVKGRYIDKKPDPEDPEDTPARARSRIFIPAKLGDNPHVNQAAYIENLRELDPFLRQQMLDGDWDADEPGDWVYIRQGLRAAQELGLYYDGLLDAGIMPPPVGGLLAIGIDWGEDAAMLLGWPLERGGIYFADDLTLESIEASQAAGLCRDMVSGIVSLGQRQRPKGWEPDLTPADIIAGKRTPGGHPPALRPGIEPLRFIEAHRYDAAGIGSQRTYMQTIHKTFPMAKSVKVAFGAPAPRSGKNTPARSYKAETLGYIRRLLERTAAGDDVHAYVLEQAAARASHGKQEWDDARILLEERRLNSAGKIAISARCDTTLRQMRKLEWLDRAAGTVRKGDDHSADAAIALLAPVMIRHR